MTSVLKLGPKLALTLQGGAHSTDKGHAGLDAFRGFLLSVTPQNGFIVKDLHKHVP